jgi:hypothetical protein
VSSVECRVFECSSVRVFECSSPHLAASLSRDPGAVAIELVGISHLPSKLLYLPTYYLLYPKYSKVPSHILARNIAARSYSGTFH